jgi:hypothetical protein
MPRRVVFIASLGHSGSTLLDLVLGGHSRVVGLGEVGRSVSSPREGTAADATTPVCSCGQPAQACVYWSGVLRRLAAEPDAADARRYETVLDAFSECFGPDAILVDSSKYLRWLGVLASLTAVDLRVLFLVRDVRSFTISEIDNVARKRAAGQAYRGIGPFATFRRWDAENRKTEAFLAGSGLPVFRLGYEELCLAPERIVPAICRFLDIPHEPSMLALERSTSHVLRGNRMRHDAGRRLVSYDPRWLVRGEWMLPALLCRRIMRSNRERVYSNDIVGDWSR